MSRKPFEFVTEGDCPKCNTSLIFYNEETYSGEATCVKCHNQIQLEDCTNKIVFKTANLIEGDCPSCGEELVFFDTDRKKGLVRCPICKQRFFLWELRSFKTEEDLESLLELIENNSKGGKDAERVIALIDMSLELLKKKFQKVIKLVKKRSAIGRGVAWTTAILTGGIGLEDLIIVPAVNYAIQRILGGKLDKVLRDFMQLIYRKVYKTAELDKSLSDEELTALLTEAYLYLITSEIDDLEIFLYQIENYAFQEKSTKDVKYLIEKIESFFVHSSQRNLEHMVVFWISLIRIVNVRYPYAPLIHTISYYYFPEYEKKESPSHEEEVEDEPTKDEKMSKYEKILGVEWDGSNFNEIKKQYRILVNKYHPDKNNNDSRKFMEVQEAYIYFKQRVG